MKNLYKSGLSFGNNLVVGADSASAAPGGGNSLTSVLIVGVLGMGICYGLPAVMKRRRGQ